MKDGYGYVLKITDSLLLSFCTQGFGPELQNPIVFKPYKSFSPWKKEFGRTDGGWLLNSHPPSATVPPLIWERVIFFNIRFCDYAYWLRAE